MKNFGLVSFLSMLDAARVARTVALIAKLPLGEQSKLITVNDLCRYTPEQLKAAGADGELIDYLAEKLQTNYGLSFSTVAADAAEQATTQSEPAPKAIQSGKPKKKQPGTGAPMPGPGDSRRPKGGIF